jgi:hypothetical protein
MTSGLKLREATSNDLLYIVRMLADDFLGGTREKPEDPLPESYLGAFHEIEIDLNNELIVAEIGNQIVGAFQLTYTPSLSFQGGKRCTIESVRVDEKTSRAGNRPPNDALGDRAGEGKRVRFDAAHYAFGTKKRAPLL